MADDITELRERVAQLEARLVHYATIADLARVDERSEAATRVMELYINRKDYHNDHLDTRVTDMEKAVSAFVASTRENIGTAKALGVAALGMATMLGGSILWAVITGAFR